MPKNGKRKLRYFIAVAGFILVALELMLGLDFIALYQSLICSVYLMFNILVDVYAWTRKLGILEGRLILSLIMVPFWTLFSLLIGLIAPKTPLETICLSSLAIVIVLSIVALVPDYIVKERSFPAKKRRANRRAIAVLCALVIPYVVTVVILTAFGMLSRDSRSLAILAFLPIFLFAIGSSVAIANPPSSLRYVLGFGILFGGVAAVPFVVALFMALPVFCKIPYACVVVAAYVSGILWLRSVRRKNLRKREARRLRTS